MPVCFAAIGIISQIPITAPKRKVLGPLLAQPGIIIIWRKVIILE